MTADDTSRDALIERVARRIHEAADYEVPVMPWDQQTDDWRAEVSSLAAAVVDAVVMPLVQERDRLRGELARRLCTHCAQSELDAVTKRAEAAEAARKALTEGVRHVLDSGYDDPMDAWYDLRAILDKHGATR